MTSIASPSGRRQTLTALFLTIAMAAVVGSALGFEHIGGYIPCKLCYEQRIPYYIGAPVMAAALVAALLGAPTRLTRLLVRHGQVRSGLRVRGGDLRAEQVPVGPVWLGPREQVVRLRVRG